MPGIFSIFGLREKHNTYLTENVKSRDSVGTSLQIGAGIVTTTLDHRMIP
jgi:hypothetical protein